VLVSTESGRIVYDDTDRGIRRVMASSPERRVLASLLMKTFRTFANCRDGAVGSFHEFVTEVFPPHAPSRRVSATTPLFLKLFRILSLREWFT